MMAEFHGGPQDGLQMELPGCPTVWEFQAFAMPSVKEMTVESIDVNATLPFTIHTYVRIVPPPDRGGHELNLIHFQWDPS